MNKAPLMKMAPGIILDKKYRIEDVIGSGGMGYVYRATNIILKREVAAKTLQVYKNSDDSALKRFHQEAQIAASIGHDNICEVIDFGIHQLADSEFDVYYLIMPLLSGQSLGQWFDSWVKPSPSIFIDIIAQTLLGLHAAHEKKIVHRDMKPDNIFITHIGDRDNFVKLLDFGISKYLESDTALGLTRTGIAMGTPLYMPPEQARGITKIDQTADIYSVGAVLYEGFVGDLPYIGTSFNDVLLKIATKPFLEPRQVNPNVPKEIEGVILKAMARSPKDRYKSALQMRQALLRAAAMANIDDRKSFVYPSNSSIPPRHHYPRSVILDSRSLSDRDNSRRIELRLKQMQGIPTDEFISRPPPPPQNTGVLKVLIGIIVLSLMATIIGVAYIFTNKSTQTDSVNIISVPSDKIQNSGGLQVIPVPTATQDATQPEVSLQPPSVTEMETDIQDIENDSAHTTSPRDEKGAGAVDDSRNPSRKPGGKKRGKGTKSEKSPATEETTDSAGEPKNHLRNRYIERDVNRIFD